MDQVITSAAATRLGREIVSLRLRFAFGAAELRKQIRETATPPPDLNEYSNPEKAERNRLAWHAVSKKALVDLAQLQQELDGIRSIAALTSWLVKNADQIRDYPERS